MCAQVAILRARGALAFADMHVPDTRLRSAHGWLKEVFYGALGVVV